MVTYLAAIASLNTQNATPETIKATGGEKKTMKYYLRPYISLGITIALGAGIAVAPSLARAQGNDLRQLLQGSD